jgi:hypothetical protein
MSLSLDIVLALEQAATWKEDKPFRDAELFRAAANRIRELEAGLRAIASEKTCSCGATELAQDTLESQPF